MTEERTTAKLLDSLGVEDVLHKEIAVLERAVQSGCPPALAEELTAQRKSREALLVEVTAGIRAAEVALPPDAARYLPERKAEEPVELPATKG